jgi:hypothetical protein
MIDLEVKQEQEPCYKHPARQCSCKHRSLRDNMYDSLHRKHTLLKSKNAALKPFKVTRAITPWAIYVIEQRQIYARQHKLSESSPEERQGFGDIMRLIAENWKKLSDEEKQPYIKKY